MVLFKWLRAEDLWWVRRVQARVLSAWTRVPRLSHSFQREPFNRFENGRDYAGGDCEDEDEDEEDDEHDEDENGPLPGNWSTQYPAPDFTKAGHS